LFPDRERTQIIEALFNEDRPRRELLSYLLSLQTEHPHRMDENPVFDIRVLSCVVELTKVGNERQVNKDISINCVIEECYTQGIWERGDESLLQQHEERVATTLEIASMLSGRNVDSTINRCREDFDLLGYLKRFHDKAVRPPIKTVFGDLGYLPVMNTRTLDSFCGVDEAIDCKDLNVAIITTFGGLKIEWVSDFGDHLFLDLSRGELKVFWHAAVCKAIADGTAGFFL
jgi:hypothetical protein